MAVVSGLDGDKPGLQDYEETNLEKKQNKDNAKFLKEAGFIKFPMWVHGPGELSKIVKDEDELKAALKGGWHESKADVPTDKPKDEPTLVSHMTLAQAKKAIAGASPAELAAFEADESEHGTRMAVLDLIGAAKDAAVAKVAKPAKTAKPKKAGKK